MSTQYKVVSNETKKKKSTKYTFLSLQNTNWLFLSHY